MGAPAINSGKAAFIIRILVESLHAKARRHDPRVLRIRRLLEAGRTSPRDGDTNDRGQVFRNHRWRHQGADDGSGQATRTRRALPAHQRISHDDARQRISAIGPDTPPEHVAALANDLMNMSYADLVRIKQDLGARGGWGSKQRMTDRLQQGVTRNELPAAGKTGLQAVRVKRSADGKGMELDPSGESNRVAWQTPDGKLHSTAIGAYGHLKQNRHLVEPPKAVEPAATPAPAAAPKARRRRKSRVTLKLLSIVHQKGGIKPDSIHKDHNYKEDILEHGLLHAISKNGISIDVMADSMERDGHFKTPPDMHPQDRLLELLQGGHYSLLAEDQHDYDKEQEEFYRAQQAAQEDKTDEQGDIAAARRRGEEAGRPEGEDVGYSTITGRDQSGDPGAGEGPGAGTSHDPEDEYDRSEPTGPVNTGWDEFGSDTDEPKADKFENPGDEVTPSSQSRIGQKPLVILKNEGGYATVGYKNHPNGQTVRMPSDSLDLFRQDQQGRVDLPPDSGNESIDKIVGGKGKLLGWGDDGLAYDAGDKVVKVSTTVPFHAFNHEHRSPTEAVHRLKGQAEINNDMIKAGVPGLLPQLFQEHGNRGFVTMEKLDTTTKLTPDQVNEVARNIEEMHKLGYALGDQIQVGVDFAGHPKIFDTGKAVKAGSGGYSKEDHIGYDQSNLERFFKDNGLTYHDPEQKKITTLMDSAKQLLEKIKSAPKDMDSGRAKFLLHNYSLRIHLLAQQPGGALYAYAMADEPEIKKLEAAAGHTIDTDSFDEKQVKLKPIEAAASPDTTPAPAAQDEPGFTGTDAEGREWRNGELVHKQDEPAKNAHQKGQHESGLEHATATGGKIPADEDEFIANEIAWLKKEYPGNDDEAYTAQAQSNLSTAKSERRWKPAAERGSFDIGDQVTDGDITGSFRGTFNKNGEKFAVIAHSRGQDTVPLDSVKSAAATTPPPVAANSDLFGNPIAQPKAQGPETMPGLFGTPVPVGPDKPTAPTEPMAGTANPLDHPDAAKKDDTQDMFGLFGPKAQAEKKPHEMQKDEYEPIYQEALKKRNQSIVTQLQSYLAGGDPLYAPVGGGYKTPTATEPGHLKVSQAGRILLYRGGASGWVTLTSEQINNMIDQSGKNPEDFPEPDSHLSAVNAADEEGLIDWDDLKNKHLADSYWQYNGNARKASEKWDAAAAAPAPAQPEPAAPVHAWAPKKFKNPEHAKNFAEWFGDSKVKNENGEPLVVYHGTTHKFDAFNATKIGEFGPAIYMTDSPNVAASYAMDRGENKGSSTIPAFVSMQNPFIIKSHEEPEKFFKWFPANSDAESIEQAKKEGYDGIIYHRPQKTGGDTHYISFSSNQVKSSMGNRGTFDPASPKFTEAVMPANPAAKIKLIQSIITRMGAKAPAPRKTREAACQDDPRVRKIRELLASR